MDEITNAIAENTMLGDFMQIVLSLAKALPKPWAQLSEKEQDSWLQSIDKQCKAAIEQAITLIACGDHVSVAATLKSVTFKDGVQASLAVDKHSQHRIDLADAAGKTVRLVIMDNEGFTSDNNKPKAEANQRALDIDDQGDDLILHDVVEFVRTSRKCTISAVQRGFKIGYNRAAQLIEALEKLQVVSPMDKTGKRVVLTEKQETK